MVILGKIYNTCTLCKCKLLLILLQVIDNAILRSFNKSSIYGKMFVASCNIVKTIKRLLCMVLLCYLICSAARLCVTRIMVKLINYWNIQRKCTLKVYALLYQLWWAKLRKSIVYVMCDVLVSCWWTLL